MGPGKLKEKLNSVQVGPWSLGDPGERMVLTAGGSFIVDLLYALYHGALGVREGSVWFMTLCVYYTLLGAARLGAVLCGRRDRPGSGAEDFVAALSGGLLILLSLVLTGVSYLSLSQGIVKRRDTILMITIATYTFTKLGFAVRRAVKWRHDPSRLLSVIRAVGYAELAASVYTMQRSMIASFGEEERRDMAVINRLSGAAVFLFVLALGISLIVKAKKGRVPNDKVRSDKSK